MILLSLHMSLDKKDEQYYFDDVLNLNQNLDLCQSKDFTSYILELDNKYDEILKTYTDFSKDDNEKYYVEDCSTCYYNYFGICLHKGIEIKFPEQYPINCWLYRNSITMRTQLDFQDDYDENDIDYY